MYDFIKCLSLIVKLSPIDLKWHTNQIKSNLFLYNIQHNIHVYIITI